MIRATAGADVWEYEYDLRGNRSAVIHNGQRTSYLVDPFAGFGDVVGTYNADGSLQARYVHGNGLVAGFTDGDSWYYEADALGSTRSVSNGSSAALTPGLLYDPFGAELGSGSGLAVAQGRFGFVGGWGVEQDASGLLHMRARQYDPISGRFFAIDPLLEKGGSLNLYGYALNNPVFYIDPSGLRCQSEIDWDIADKNFEARMLSWEITDYQFELSDKEADRNKAERDQKTKRETIKKYRDYLDKEWANERGSALGPKYRDINNNKEFVESAQPLSTKVKAIAFLDSFLAGLGPKYRIISIVYKRNLLGIVVEAAVTIADEVLEKKIEEANETIKTLNSEIKEIEKNFDDKNENSRTK
jgi:RHS repeat-associated protein